MPCPRRPGRLPVTPEDKRIFSEAQLAQGWRLACKAVTREAVEIVVPVQEQQGFSALAAEAADEEPFHWQRTMTMAWLSISGRRRWPQLW